MLNKSGQEVSGYVDYAQRLQSEKFEQYFDGRRVLRPQESDLSYHNWLTKHTMCSNSPNWQPMTSLDGEFWFRNMRNRKTFSPSENCCADGLTERVVIESPGYLQILIYDHWASRLI